MCSGATYALFIPFSVYLQSIYKISHVAIVMTNFTFHGIYPFPNFLYANSIIVNKGTKVAVALFLIIYL